MRINLFQTITENFTRNDFAEVIATLDQINGFVKYIPLEVDYCFDSSQIKTVTKEKEEFEKQKNNFSKYIFNHSKNISFPYREKEISTYDLFKACEDVRDKYKIQEEEFVFLLTEYSNNANQFAGSDPNDKRNFFVQTSNWDYFLKSDIKYPVAYHVAVMPIQKLTYPAQSELFNNSHKVPIGCMMDYCEDKTAITLKLRTADICVECQRKIRSKMIDTLLVRQVFETIDNIRGQMLFKERFLASAEPSSILIEHRKCDITFTAINTKLNLTPIEKSIYLLFLSEPEGIRFKEINNYKSDLKALYVKLSGSDDPIKITHRVNALVNPFDNAPLRQSVAKINRKLKDLLGEEVSKQYRILGNKGEKMKIILDRKLVEWEKRNTIL